MLKQASEHGSVRNHRKATSQRSLIYGVLSRSTLTIPSTINASASYIRFDGPAVDAQREPARLATRERHWRPHDGHPASTIWGLGPVLKSIEDSWDGSDRPARPLPPLTANEAATGMATTLIGPRGYNMEVVQPRLNGKPCYRADSPGCMSFPFSTTPSCFLFRSPLVIASMFVEA